MSRANAAVDFVRTEVPQDTLVEYFQYLDDLRESGDTNMFGAPAYLQDSYDISFHRANQITAAWMKTFGINEPAERVGHIFNGPSGGSP